MKNNFKVDNMKCTNCGAEAVKTEDYAVFDCLKTNESVKEIIFIGFIRYSLCHTCIEKQLKKNIKSALLFRLIITIVMIVMLIFAIFAAIIFNVISFGVETIGYVVLGCIVIILSLIVVRPKSSKKKREFYKEFETHSISQILSDDSSYMLDYGELNYNLLYNKDTNSSNPNDTLTKEQIQYFRHCFPINGIKDKFEKQFNIPLPQEYMQSYKMIYGKTNKQDN